MNVHRRLLHARVGSGFSFWRLYSLVGFSMGHVQFILTEMGEKEVNHVGNTKRVKHATQERRSKHASFSVSTLLGIRLYVVDHGLCLTLASVQFSPWLIFNFYFWALLSGAFERSVLRDAQLWAELVLYWRWPTRARCSMGHANVFNLSHSLYFGVRLPLTPCIFFFFARVGRKDPSKQKIKWTHKILRGFV